MFAFIIFAIIVAVIIFVLVNSNNKSSIDSISPASKELDNVSDEELILGAHLLTEALQEGKPPYMEDETILKVVSNAELMEKGNDIISRLYQFFVNNCFSPEFCNELEMQISSDAAEDDTIKLYFVGDIIRCFNGLGIDADVQSPHGTLLYMSILYLTGNERLCTPYTIKLAKPSDIKQAQNICEGVTDMYELINGYDPFVVSSIFVNLDLQKRCDYLDMMIELSKYLVEIHDVNHEKSKAFIASLQETKLKDGSDIVDRERVASDSESIELWGITDPVKDHEEVSETWTCNVAGISRRCTKEDIGGIVGYVEAEPTNEFNPNAMAVYLHNGKHIGYIREDELDDYRYWSRCKKMPFVGYINEYEGHLSARIHIIVPKSRDFLLKLAGNFFISTKEKGKLGLIPNVVDMIVPNRN